MPLITHAAAESYEAKFLSPALFIGCAGARDEDTETRLAEFFNRGDTKNVQSLRRNSPLDETCCFAGHDWRLSSKT